ncbi:hypothetical protein [Streptomyces sp. YKOK-I1]
MDTHCLVTPDQGTAYGCVREVELDGEVLRVTLEPSSLEVLPRILAYGRPDARPRLIKL